MTDNIVPEKEESDLYIPALHNHPLMETVSIPIGQGLEGSARRWSVVATQSHNLD